jgi:hypothetical protein
MSYGKAWVGLFFEYNFFVAHNIMNLYKYLLRHIDFDIDHEFVKEFYKIQKNKTKFKVNVDQIAVWLGDHEAQ